VAAFAGVVVGEGLVMWTSLAGITTASLFPALPASVTDVNIGLLALAANVLVTWALTLLLPTRR
jgi:SSS family solute:Na+ symporter